jgi:hypothetical protein
VALSPTIIIDVPPTTEFVDHIIVLADATFVCALTNIGKPLLTPVADTVTNESPDATVAIPLYVLAPANADIVADVATIEPSDATFATIIPLKAAFCLPNC